jgi:hypothetical protein
MANAIFDAGGEFSERFLIALGYKHGVITKTIEAARRSCNAALTDSSSYL